MRSLSTGLGLTVVAALLGKMAKIIDQLGELQTCLYWI